MGPQIEITNFNGIFLISEKNTQVSRDATTCRIFNKICDFVENPACRVCYAVIIRRSLRSYTSLQPESARPPPRHQERSDLRSAATSATLAWPPGEGAHRRAASSSEGAQRPQSCSPHPIRRGPAAPPGAQRPKERSDLTTDPDSGDTHT